MGLIVIVIVRKEEGSFQIPRTTEDYEEFLSNPRKIVGALNYPKIFQLRKR